MIFFVAGIPAPKGSARAFVVKGRAIVTAANVKTKPWEQAIRAAAYEAGCKLSQRAIKVEATFYFSRPKGHFTSKGLIRPAAPIKHTKKPDVDKLARALLDGLTGVAFVDDSQVVEVVAKKRYLDGEENRPGATVEVEER